MRAHIRDVICGGDDALGAYVLGWLARMVQHPDQPGEVALVLRGKKGTGKGTLGNWLVKLLGQHAVHVAHAKHLVGNFNAHLRDAVFVFADEAFFAGDKQHEGALKALVTEPSITIEAKYQNAVMIANMTHILMASNSDWVVPATTDERRFCVMDVSDTRRGDIPYFDAISTQMESGGLAAMLHDLLHHDLSDFNVRQVPQTRALADQKRHSLDSLNRWWLTVLQRGFVWRSRHGAAMFTNWDDFVTTELLYRSYLQWCGETRDSRPKSREQLGGLLKGLYKSSRRRKLYPIYEIEVWDAGPKGECKPAVLTLLLQKIDIALKNQ
jgi:phage/plasmid-associated DNA primase